jgi:hypothetical protein
MQSRLHLVDPGSFGSLPAKALYNNVILIQMDISFTILFQLKLIFPLAAYHPQPRAEVFGGD